MTRTVAVAVCLALVASPVVGEPFHNAKVGGAVAVVPLDDAGGRTAHVPVAGRTTLLVFWRAGQALSDQALSDVAALAAEWRTKGVDTVAVADAAVPAAVLKDRAAGTGLAVVHDRAGRAWQAWDIIVTPSTAVVRNDGRLAWYLPGRPAGYRELVRAHLAHVLGEIGDAELARRAGTNGETLGAAAEGVQAAHKRGVALAAERKWNEAAAAFADVLRGDPDHGDAAVRLGWVELELGRPKDALARFERVLTRYPGSPAARMGRGVATLRGGDRAEGVRLLEEAVVLNPEPVRGHWELARAYEAAGDVDRALAHYRSAYRKLLQGRK